MTDLNQLIPWIPLLASVLAIMYAVRGSKRTDKQDATSDAKQYTRIETKLDSLISGFDDMRLEFRSQQKQINDQEMRLTRIETRCEIRTKDHMEPDHDTQ